MQQFLKALSILAGFSVNLAGSFPSPAPQNTSDEISNAAISPLFVARGNTTAVRIRDPVFGERDVSYFVTPQGTAIMYALNRATLTSPRIGLPK